MVPDATGGAEAHRRDERAVEVESFTRISAADCLDFG